jgi:hypothetical protein
MNKLIITPVAQEDLPAILDVQRKAFLEVARIYNVKSLLPLEQTLESLSDELASGTILKAAIAGAIVGSVRAYIKNDNC